jgi:hypothetical protein
MRPNNRDQAHYRGDRRNFDEMHLAGPDFGYAFLKPVEAEYDPVADVTTIRFETLLQDKLPKEAIMFGAQCLHEAQQRLLTLAVAGHRDSMARLVAGDGHFRAVAEATT